MTCVLSFHKRSGLAGVAAAALLLCSPLPAQTGRAAKSDVPNLEVYASWPQPLPNKWSIGQISGVALGAQDHIWIIQRPASIGADEKYATTTPPSAECCIPAPPVIEFDAQGKVVQAWGGPGTGYDWPTNEHGIFVDYKGNVWISGVGGRQPADMDVDPKTNELYVADGDGGAQRVIVFDAETGAFKRLWGAYGEKPQEGAVAKHDPDGPPSKAFSAAVHCVRLAKDGMVYVCDRNGDRVQAFHQDGTFVKEGLIAPKTMGIGTAFDLDFTPDQRYSYVADGTNHKVWIMQRDSLEVVGSIGQFGHNAGEFRNVHALVVDSKGNLITAEVSENKRLQKFVPKAAGAKRASR